MVRCTPVGWGDILNGEDTLHDGSRTSFSLIEYSNGEKWRIPTFPYLCSDPKGRGRVGQCHLRIHPDHRTLVL